MAASLIGGPILFYNRLKALQRTRLQPRANVRYFAPGGWTHGVANVGMQVTVNSKKLGTWLGEMIADSASWANQASWGTTCGGSSITLTGDIATKYNELGGCDGVLGKPSKGVTQLNSGGRYAEFVNNVTKSTICSSSATGAHEVHGPIFEWWLSKGGADGNLFGYPIEDQVESEVRGGVKNEFQRGGIYYSPRTGAHGVSGTGAVGQKYLSMGTDSSWLGLPTSDEYKTGFMSFDSRQDFEHGYIYWSGIGGTAAHEY